jgi:hypothetical protein
VDQAKQNEFLNILDNVCSIPRPLRDYSKLSSATFAACEFIRRLMEIQGFFMAYYRATGKLPVTKKGIEHILVASMSLTPTSLAAIYCACSDFALVSLLANLKIEELFIGAELEKRLADKSIGTVLVLAPFFTGTPPTEKWLTKKLKVDNIKAHNPLREQEMHDIRYDSITRALELAGKLESPIYDPGPLPRFPLEMRPVEASFWNVALAKAWRNGHKTLRKGIIPVLENRSEAIPDEVRNSRREKWRTIARREKIRKGTDDFPADGPAAWRAQQDFAETARSMRGQDIESETVGNIPTPEDSLVERETGAHAYAYVTSRWGEKGQKYLDTLIATEGNVSAASKAAGISRVTGTLWRKEIQIKLSEKKPTK